MNIELKSIGNGNAVQLSSIDGWREEKLPKVLVIVQCSKEKMEPLPRSDGTKTKARDIEVLVTSFYVYYITKDHLHLFVDWPGTPTFQEVTATNWKENPEFLERIREIAKEANNSSTSPVKLVAGKNSSLCRIHYNCSNHRNLPSAPPEVVQKVRPMIEPLVGARLRLWKDHSKRGGRTGYLDEAMLHWEDLNDCKSTGRLDVQFKDGTIQTYPEFRRGRDDFWSGFALELLLEDLNEEMSRTPSGTIGSDLTIEDLSDKRIVGRLSNKDLRKLARKEGKHSLLRRLQERYGIEPLDSDVSRGSTVTRDALQRLAIAVAASEGVLPEDISTKKKCVRRMLELRDRPADSDDVSRGGTITAYALLKIWL